MAKQPFRHGEYRLSWLKEEACAVKGSGDTRNRFRLGVYTEEEGRAALVSFVVSQERGEAIADGTVGALWKAYRADREKDGKVMRAFDCTWHNLAPFFANRSVFEINKDVCRAYAEMRFETGAGRRGKRVSNDTVWSELLKLSSCFSWAVEAKLIAEAPATWLPARTKKSQEVLTPADVLKLMDACNFECAPSSQGIRRVEHFHLRVFIVLMMCTAGRPGAVLELTGGRCFFGQRLIDLRVPDETDDPMSKAFKKGRAMVHMNDLALAVLMEARQQIEKAGDYWDTARVVQWKGQGIDRISKSFRSAVVRAGLPDWVSPHKLRHATATWVDEAGIDPAFVTELLGHKKGSRVTEEVYVHRKGTRTKEATSVIDRALGGKRMKVVR